ncbi:MAG: hypothetical protein IJ410_03395 [Oscillospiraceae bacterium]|nr:hypothetical protein [Oscillospiraceae bacterium]
MYRYILFEFVGMDVAYLVAEDDTEELETIARTDDGTVRIGEVLLDEPLPPKKRWFAWAKQPKTVNPFFLRMKFAGRNADYL